MPAHRLLPPSCHSSPLQPFFPWGNPSTWTSPVSLISFWTSHLPNLSSHHLFPGPLLPIILPLPPSTIQIWWFFPFPRLYLSFPEGCPTVPYKVRTFNSVFCHYTKWRISIYLVALLFAVENVLQIMVLSSSACDINLFLVLSYLPLYDFIELFCLLEIYLKYFTFQNNFVDWTGRCIRNTWFAVYLFYLNFIFEAHPHSEDEVGWFHPGSCNIL